MTFYLATKGGKTLREGTLTRFSMEGDWNFDLRDALACDGVFREWIQAIFSKLPITDLVN